MKLLLLNIHLEVNHNRLRKLIELDGRPGVFSKPFLVSSNILVQAWTMSSSSCTIMRV